MPRKAKLFMYSGLLFRTWVKNIKSGKRCLGCIQCSSMTHENNTSRNRINSGWNKAVYVHSVTSICANTSSWLIDQCYADKKENDLACKLVLRQNFRFIFFIFETFLTSVQMFVVLSGHVADVLMMILWGDGISRTETLHCISN